MMQTVVGFTIGLKVSS